MVNKLSVKLYTDECVGLITTMRRNMNAKAISLWDRVVLSRGFIIETIN